jgi:uncharacterized protein (TIGR03067 family)
MNATLLALGLILLGAIVSLADERASLAGNWKCTSATIDGAPLAAETAKLLTLTLTADRFKTQRGDQVLFDSTYTVDATKDPKQIDMIGTEGELTGKPALGIYKLDGDKLTLCYTMPGNERPAKFESAAKSGVYLIEWVRARP